MTTNPITGLGPNTEQAFLALLEKNHIPEAIGLLRALNADPSEVCHLLIVECALLLSEQRTLVAERDGVNDLDTVQVGIAPAEGKTAPLALQIVVSLGNDDEDTAQALIRTINDEDTLTGVLCDLMKIYHKFSNIKEAAE